MLDMGIVRRAELLHAEPPSLTKKALHEEPPSLTKKALHEEPPSLTRELHEALE